MSAKLYHLHHKDYLEDIPFWIKLAQQYGSPILELGCGTGRVTLPLFRQGYEITGVDRDPDMLKILVDETKTSEKINFVQEDFTKLKINNKFPLIFMPCNTYSTLSKENRQITLKMVNHHIEQGGAFSFSLPNPTLLKALPAKSELELEELIIDPNNGDAIQVSSEWENNGKQVMVYWHYDRLLSDGQVIRSTTETIHFLNSISQYSTELESMGYSLRTYGDFDHSPYNEESDYMIMVAEKV